MGTFLVTPQMNPALRARVERAVSHRKKAKEAAARLGLSGAVAAKERVRLARVLPVVLLVIVAGLGMTAMVYGRRELEKERAELLGVIAVRRAALPAGNEAFLGVVDHFITETAGDTAPPDVIEASLKGPDGLAKLLARPSVYIHATAGDLADSRKIDEAARASDKDSFLHCLAKPPASGSEKDLLASVKGVYFQGAKVEDETSSIRRLTDARLALSVVGPAFEERVTAAQERKSLHLLRKELDAAPATDRAARAVGAEVLIVVADVAAKTSTREARVAFLEVPTKTVLYRGRLKVDAAGRTAASTFYSAEVDGCAFALAVRQSLSQ